MKISKLLENPTPSSTSDLNGGGYGGQAPRFGRDPEILEDEQIDETSAGATGTGSVGGGVATDLGMQRRSKGSIFQGVRTSKKFVNSPVTEDPLKDKSLDALSQAKNVIAQKRMADLEKWEQDFKDSMAKKLKQKPSFEPVPVSQPGEKHSALKSRMSNLDMAIQKHQQVEALAQKLDKVGRLSPAMQSAIDTRMHIKLGPKDNYQTLNRKLDSIIEMLNKNLNTYKIARKKPKPMREDGITAGINKYYDDRASGALDPRTGQKQPYLQQWALKVNGKVDGSNIFRSEQAAMLARSALLRKNPNVQIGLVTRGGLAEDEKVSGRMKMDDYYRLADAIQEKLKQAIQTGDKARIQELNKQRDELDAHVKKHGMMPEGIEEADMNRRDFIKGVGAVAATGATNQAQPNQRQDLGNSFSTAVVEIGGVPFNVVLDTVSKSIYMLNQKSDGTPLVNKPGSFIVIRNGKLEPRMDLAPNIMNALQKAGLLDTQQGVKEGVRDLGYDAQSLIMKLRRDVEERRLQPTRQAVLSAARELAGDMDFAPELLVRQVLGQGVAEHQLNELDFFAPVTTFIKMTNGSYIQADWRKSQGNPGLSDSASFVNFKPVNPTVAKQLGLDSHQRNNSISNPRDGTIVPGGPIQGSGPLANRGYEVVDYNKPETMKGLPPEIKSEFIKWVQKQGVAEGFNGEYDDEAGMADNNLETLRRAVDGIDNVIDSGDNLPEWCQEKIAVAKSMLVTVWDYMKSEEERNGGEKIDEGWVKNAIASATLAGAALGAGNAQAADLGGYNTQYLQGVVSGQVARPMISVDVARQELQARANGKTQTQAPANTNVAPQQGTNQTPNLSAYETRYLQGVVLGKVPRPTVSVDAARQELQLRASRTQSDVNTISSRWGSNQPNNANVITSRGVQREGMNDNPKVDLSPNYPNYSKLVGEFIGMKNNRARFLIIDAELKPGVRETEKIFKARTTNTPISIEISKVRNRTVVEAELSEENLLAKELANQFKMFNKANDRELSTKPEDREIIAKEAAHVPGMVDRIENQITAKIATEHPEIIQQYGKQIVQDAISSIAVYHRHMREVTPANIDDMVDEIIQQLDRHLHMREDENS